MVAVGAGEVPDGAVSLGAEVTVRGALAARSREGTLIVVEELCGAWGETWEPGVLM